MDLQIIRGQPIGEDDALPALNYTWSVEEYKDQGMELKIQFEKPEEVSTGLTPDILKIEFLETRLF